MDHLGIDLSKAYFDVTLLQSAGDKAQSRFENNASGFKALSHWLKAQGISQVQACMEATNIYWEKLAQDLYDQGHTVYVVNPARIKGHAMSQLRRSKTDQVDGAVIADFCRSHRDLRAWTPPNPELRKLRNLVRHRADLLNLVVQQKNRLADCQDDDLQAAWQRLLDTCTTEIRTVEQQIEQHLAHHTALQETYTLLRSVKGLGPVACWTLMAEMPDLAEYENAAAAAADAGVTPAHHESGDTVHRKPKMSKVGKATIRSVLYFPALTAMRFNPLIRTFAERLEKHGKHKMAIIVAVMRKLIHLAYGVLKHKMPFDPNFGSSLQPAT
jgi:transposase